MANIATGKPFGNVLPNVRQQEASTFELAEEFAGCVLHFTGRDCVGVGTRLDLGCRCTLDILRIDRRPDPRAAQLHDHVQETRPAVVAARNP